MKNLLVKIGAVIVAILTVIVVILATITLPIRYILGCFQMVFTILYYKLKGYKIIKPVK
jgi:hypothetical protein